LTNAGLIRALANRAQNEFTDDQGEILQVPLYI